MDNTILEQIARHLMLNSSYLTNLGLFHGKMGIVLFFAHYARFTNNSLYENFGEELLDEIYNEIHAGIGIDFENGLCGIGWAMEYLLLNRFIEGDSDEMLRNIDSEIMRIDLSRIEDVSLNKGLQGISYYIQSRLSSPFRKYQNKPFDIIYLKKWKSLTINNQYNLNQKQLLNDIINIPPNSCKISDMNIGLENGAAGMGIKIIGV